MEVKIYKLPTLDDGVAEVEHKYCELLNEYHNGKKLEPELMDWLDTANNWLITTEL